MSASSLRPHNGTRNGKEEQMQAHWCQAERGGGLKVRVLAHMLSVLHVVAHAWKQEASANTMLSSVPASYFVFVKPEAGTSVSLRFRHVSYWRYLIRE
jgi:hypothetical protein